MGVTTWLATLMHAMEVGIWAVAYRLLDDIAVGLSVAGLLLNCRLGTEGN